MKAIRLGTKDWLLEDHARALGLKFSPHHKIKGQTYYVWSAPNKWIHPCTMHQEAEQIDADTDYRAAVMLMCDWASVDEDGEKVESDATIMGKAQDAVREEVRLKQEQQGICSDCGRQLPSKMCGCCCTFADPYQRFRDAEEVMWSDKSGRWFPYENIHYSYDPDRFAIIGIDLPPLPDDDKLREKGKELTWECRLPQIDEHYCDKHGQTIFEKHVDKVLDGFNGKRWILREVEKPPSNLCVHGESLDGLCNACADEHGPHNREKPKELPEKVQWYFDRAKKMGAPPSYEALEYIFKAYHQERGE
jgi:hypothetical protein